MTPLIRRHIFFGAFVLAVALLNLDALRALVQLALANPTVSHVIAVPLVASVLIYSDREIVFRSLGAAPVVGGSMIVSGLALTLLGPKLSSASTMALTPSITGVALAWTAGFVMFYGLASARSALFPLAFMVFMIPMPNLVVDGATQFLKSGSTEAVASLFRLTGTPFHRQEYVFTLPGFVIEIADECSGIRSSIALFLTGLLAGYRFLQTPWTKIALVLVILPIAVLKNAIRIVGLSLLAMHVDPSFLTGQLHHEGGFVFFLLALALIAPLFVLLRWSEGARSQASAS